MKLFVDTNEDVTPDLIRDNRSLNRDALEASPGSVSEQRKRPRQNFLEMGLQPGDTIVYEPTGETATIADGRTVYMRGRLMSLEQASKLAAGVDRRVRPGRWKFGEHYLKALYDRTY